jgi:glycosyltransferase involved in cell wall biosynthesis
MSFLEPLARPARAFIQYLDFRASARVDGFVTSSRTVQERIAQFYGRDAVVIPPPVDLEALRSSGQPVQDYYLVVSALMRYKRIDIAVDACTALGLPLVVVGVGEDETRLRARAGPTVSFVGRCSDEEVAKLYAGSRALLFPTNEDFGITPLEAMASGRPVIALRAGGAVETVKERVTGVFFEEPTAESLTRALVVFDLSLFIPATIRRHAESFSREHFQNAMRSVIDRIMNERIRGLATAALS